MILTRTEQIQIPSNDTLFELCHYSKNLWNEANYQVRQEFIFNRKWIRYNALAGTFKTSENFKSINAQTGQQILKVLDKRWKSFFKAIKEYAKHPEKFLGKPRLPGYKKKMVSSCLFSRTSRSVSQTDTLYFPKILE